MRILFTVVLAGIAAILLTLFTFNNVFTKRGDTIKSMMTLMSRAFSDRSAIPARYTCDGEGVSPPLSIAGTPGGAESLVLIVFDPDVPKALKSDGRFLHSLVFNIPADTREIGPNAFGLSAQAGVSGVNDAGERGYIAPCPPREYEPREHRYIFHIYALNTVLSLEPGARESDVRRAMEGHIIGEAELTGRYQR